MCREASGLPNGALSSSGGGWTVGSVEVGKEVGGGETEGEREVAAGM